MGVQVTEAAIFNQRSEMRKTATAAKKCKTDPHCNSVR
jgi:hypothetical protein